MPASTKKLPKLVAALEGLYGRPRPLPASGALELILWENIAYLADDVRRTQAWMQLQERVGEISWRTYRVRRIRPVSGRGRSLILCETSNDRWCSA